MELAMVGLGRVGRNKAFHNARGNSYIPYPVRDLKVGCRELLR